MLPFQSQVRSWHARHGWGPPADGSQGAGPTPGPHTPSRPQGPPRSRGLHSHWPHGRQRPAPAAHNNKITMGMTQEQKRLIRTTHKKSSNLAFYAQSVITVLAGRSKKSKNLKAQATALMHSTLQVSTTIIKITLFLCSRILWSTQTHCPLQHFPTFSTFKWEKYQR